MSVESPQATGPEPRIELVQTTDYFYHVRVRPKEAFTEFRTPIDDARTAWETIGEGCDVREGLLDSGRWRIESVLVPLSLADDGAHAEALTGQLVAELES